MVIMALSDTPKGGVPDPKEDKDYKATIDFLESTRNSIVRCRRRSLYESGQCQGLLKAAEILLDTIINTQRHHRIDMYGEKVGGILMKPILFALVMINLSLAVINGYYVFTDTHTVLNIVGMVGSVFASGFIFGVSV